MAVAGAPGAVPWDPTQMRNEQRGYRRVGKTDHQDLDAAARRVRGVIERLVREGTVVARSDGTLHEVFPVATSAAESEALRGWVAREGATRTVEIGLGYGVSTLHVCEGLLGNADPAAVRHVAIDPHQATRFSGCGLQSLEEAGVTGIVERAVSFFLRNLGWGLEEVSEQGDLHRWAVLRTSTAPDARPFDYYVDF